MRGDGVTWARQGEARWFGEGVRLDVGRRANETRHNGAAAG